VIDDGQPWIEELAGRVLAKRWQLGTLIGAGGAGAVFESEHVAVGRLAAAKVLRPDLRKADQVVRRFHREAKAAAAVGHPGVVEVIDFDVDPVAGPFLVMERLSGRTLFDDLRAQGRMPLARALRIVDDVLDTLEAVHESGIIHRDLKPENVFLVEREPGSGRGPREAVKVLDFGISRFDSAGTSTILTAPGSLIGTPRYMAPEQARGEPSIDARADVYAAGGLLYTCLAGQPPYHDVPARQVLYAVFAGPPQPLDSFGLGIPQAVCDAVARAMSKLPGDRFQSAAEMRVALSETQ
jgi:serine/threonine-protein kinase